MKRVLYVILPVAVVILVIAWIVDPGPTDANPRATGEPALDDPMDSPISSTHLHQSTRDELSEEQRAMLADPRVLRFSQRLEFEEEVRAFFETHPSLPGTERKRKAEDIRRQLEALSKERQISQQEKLLVEIALLQATIEDEDRQRKAANELIERYRDASSDRLNEWAQEPRPEFETYKEAEARIVREVMDRDDFPDDASRQRYLDRRLRAARQEAYGESSQSP